ncbi:MAG: 50S ribosomal protein L19, partial [Hyphomonas sp.]
MIEQLEAEERVRVLGDKKIPAFSPGDTLAVNVKIKEGDRERVQRFEGVCIARSGGSLSES